MASLQNSDIQGLGGQIGYVEGHRPQVANNRTISDLRPRTVLDVVGEASSKFVGPTVDRGPFVGEPIRIVMTKMRHQFWPAQQDRALGYQQPNGELDGSVGKS